MRRTNGGAGIAAGSGNGSTGLAAGSGSAALLALLLVLPAAPAAAQNLFTYYSFAGLSKAPGDNYDMARCLDGTPTGIAVRPGVGADANKWLVWFEGGGCVLPILVDARRTLTL